MMRFKLEEEKGKAGERKGVGDEGKEEDEKRGLKMMRFK